MSYGGFFRSVKSNVEQARANMIPINYILPFMNLCVENTSKLTVADPGFPVGGRGPRRGAWTPEAATFHKMCMSK